MRCYLAAVVAVQLAGLLPVAAAEQLKLTVKETAGIRRFGYPVNTLVTLPRQLPASTPVRLLDQNRPIPVQVTPRGGGRLELDFTLSPGPFEQRELVLEYGPDVQALPSAPGMTVEEGADALSVRHSSALQFVVPRSLEGLLQSVKTNRTDYLKPASAGLCWRRPDGTIHRAAQGSGGKGKYVASVRKAGSLACTLSFQGSESLGGNELVSSIVTMEFPRSKSWVQVTWTIEDPRGEVSGMGADLNLNIAGEPALVDFGCGSLVYVALKRGETAELTARQSPADRPEWQVVTGSGNTRRPYVASAKEGPICPAENWTHLMDRERCTAAAVAPGAGSDQVRLVCAADGRLQLWRDFAAGKDSPKPGKKTFTCYYHFVGMPVHVGALTSPQAMLAPLEVKATPP